MIAALLLAAGQGSDAGVAPGVVRGIERELPRVVSIRRTIHEHPELGERETETAKLVAARLEELGLEVRRGVGKTGVVGVLRGGKPGACAMWRADMDALPMSEETSLPFKSARKVRLNGRSTSSNKTFFQTTRGRFSTSGSLRTPTRTRNMLACCLATSRPRHTVIIRVPTKR